MLSAQIGKKIEVGVIAALSSADGRASENACALKSQESRAKDIICTVV